MWELVTFPGGAVAALSKPRGMRRASSTRPERFGFPSLFRPRIDDTEPMGFSRANARRLVARLVAFLFLMVAPAQAQDIATISVHFPAGASGTTMQGVITGRRSISYMVGAQAGQVMSVRLTSPNDAAYFNVYAPGSGPGDQALAVSEMSGTPMVPDINVFSGVLPASGVYTINVHLFRAAARAGERAPFSLTIGIAPLADAEAPVQGDYADGLAGGPDYYEVAVAGGGALNLRVSPSGAAAVTTRLTSGTQLRNLGCRMNEGRRWCHVATLADPGFEGWAAGDFLREGSGVPEGRGDALVSGTNFNATGTLPCARSRKAPDESCEWGVMRQGDGSGTITVTWPDGGQRIIGFERNMPVWFDRSEADGGRDMTVIQDGELFKVMIGEERYEFPLALLDGG